MMPDYESLMLANADIHYSVDGSGHADKLSAFVASNNDAARVRFHWRESLFDHIDWSTEPVQDLQCMVDYHVRTIRDMYDHVALWFSGGFDSYSIFKAFHRNGLTIDEFFIYDREWNQGLCKTDCLVAEQTATVIKQTIWPNLKITKVQWGSKDAVYRFFRKHGSDWIYHANNVFRISQNSRQFLYSMNDSVRRTCDNKKSITLNGIDKPRLDLRDNTWYACRTDGAMYSEKDSSVLHFWTIPELYVKQCWLMIRWLESRPDTNHHLVHDLQTHRLGDQIYNEWNLAMGRDMPMHRFCHGVTDKQTFYGAQSCLEARPLLEHAQLDAPDVTKAYYQGLQNLSWLCGDLWQQERLPSMLSRSYLITQRSMTC